MSGFPPAMKNPCDECPWRRDSPAGHLGPLDAQGWIDVIHGEQAIACHKTITDTDDKGHGDWANPAMRQCRGAVSFRANVCKAPRNDEILSWPPDTKRVFATDAEFIEHHSPDSPFAKWRAEQQEASQ